ncbi:hypothetical protein PMAYCL1PPCAC_19303, partial [Pristionchus mayeri]
MIFGLLNVTDSSSVDVVLVSDDDAFSLQVLHSIRPREALAGTDDGRGNLGVLLDALVHCRLEGFTLGHLKTTTLVGNALLHLLVQAILSAVEENLHRVVLGFVVLPDGGRIDLLGSFGEVGDVGEIVPVGQVDVLLFLFRIARVGEVLEQTLLSLDDRIIVLRETLEVLLHVFTVTLDLVLGLFEARPHTLHGFLATLIRLIASAHANLFAGLVIGGRVGERGRFSGCFALATLALARSSGVRSDNEGGDESILIEDFTLLDDSTSLLVDLGHLMDDLPGHGFHDGFDGSLGCRSRERRRGEEKEEEREGEKTHPC